MNTTKVDIEDLTRRFNHQRNHFCFYEWLLDRDGQPENEFRRWVLFGWADEMATFQEQANETGEPVEYVQRGKVVRTIRPERRAA
jgi:hypothetical protein